MYKKIKEKLILKKYLFKKKYFQPFLYKEYPRILYIFLTDECNLRCFFCREKDYAGLKNFDFENIYKLEKPIKNAEIIDLTGTGEPFIYEKLEEILNYIKKINDKKDLIHLTSNGTLFTKAHAKMLNENLGKLTISLNASNNQSYKKYMMGDFEKVLNNIRNFIDNLEDSKKEKLILSFVANKDNFYEIPDFILLAKEMGISQVSILNLLARKQEFFKYTLYHVKEEYNKIFEEAAKIAKSNNIKLIGRKFYQNIQPTPYEFVCYLLYQHCIIWPNGDLSPCCIAGRYKVGNIFEEGFEKVWFGPKYKRFRFFGLKMCRNCTLNLPLEDKRSHYQLHLLE